MMDRDPGFWGGHSMHVIVEINYVSMHACMYVPTYVRTYEYMFVRPNIN